MTSQPFRKLYIDLPKQSIVDERQWLVAGLLLAFCVLLMSALAYFSTDRKVSFPLPHKEKTLSHRNKF